MSRLLRHFHKPEVARQPADHPSARRGLTERIANSILLGAAIVCTGHDVRVPLTCRGASRIKSRVGNRASGDDYGSLVQHQKDRASGSLLCTPARGADSRAQAREANLPF